MNNPAGCPEVYRLDLRTVDLEDTLFRARLAEKIRDEHLVWRTKRNA